MILRTIGIDHYEMEVLIIAFIMAMSLSSFSLKAQSSGIDLNQPREKRVYYTARASSTIVVDGVITDDAWNQVEWSSGFTQRQPLDGGAPTAETAFKILYDNKYIYVATRCFDAEPSKIVKRMSRRDGFAGDWIEINIDSYHDLRSAFSFTASVSGVKNDEFITQDGRNWDKNWNPIWNFKSMVDSLGWIAEIAIPLSQLRFDNREEQIWGLQFTRRDFRNESRSNWQYNPQNSGYWVSAFGELHGIKGIKAKRQIEIQPFVLAQHTTSKPIEGNPYRTGRESKFTGGLDGKIGITNDLTLDFTVNPDFGQVEADPAALNLNGFEVFFREQRPFFVENRSTFNYNISKSNAGGAYDNDNLFYSRRIGASPHRKIFELGEAYFVDAPDFTSILGAAKFSGKTNGGLTIGVLESVTQKEFANISISGKESKEVVEPLTNYSVLRFQQDINEGNTVVGIIGTATNRTIDDSNLDFLHKAAYSGGVDLLHQWNNKKWRLNASLVTSHVKGSQNAILRTQQNFAHGFNRPDADHLSVDETATSLTGTGGNINVGQYGQRIQFQVGATYRSPGIELNDLGFLRNADEINQYYWMGFRWNKPFSVFRNFRVNFNEWSRWDFGGRHLYNAFNANVNANFRNFYSIGLGFNIETNDISNTWLRTGPAFRKPHGYGGNLQIGTDSRKKFRFSIRGNGGGGFDKSVNRYSIRGELRIQASDALNASIGSSWSRNFREDQYVSSPQTDDFGRRYLLGELVQKTLDFTLRLNYNITPDLTVQYYGQPYISRGIYSDFKYVEDPLARKVARRYTSFLDSQISFHAEEDGYWIDEQIDGMDDYFIHDPNFDFVQFRSNLVARWEYKPGSEIFLVWSQGSTAFISDIGNSISQSLNDNLWDDSLTNTFLAKFTYRFTN